MEFKKYGDVELDEGHDIQPNVILGTPVQKQKSSSDSLTIIGKNAILRSGTVIYSNVKIGDNFKTGHGVLVREHTTIGDNVLVGSNSIIENKCKIGNNVSVQSNVYIPTNTTIGDNVFLGPNACLTNDKYPVRKKAELIGPILEKGVTIGANSTILPGVRIGEGSIVAAGSVVTKDVSPWKLSIGSPAKERNLPEELRRLNDI